MGGGAAVALRKYHHVKKFTENWFVNSYYKIFK